MRNLRKVMAMTLVVAMVLSLMSFSVFAKSTTIAPYLKFVVEKNGVTERKDTINIKDGGSTVTLEVYMVDSTGEAVQADAVQKGASVRVKVPTTIIDLDSVTATAGVYEGASKAFLKKDGYVAANDGSRAVASSEAPVATFTFKLIEDLPLGDYEFTILNPNGVETAVGGYTDCDSSAKATISVPDSTIFTSYTPVATSVQYGSPESVLPATIEAIGATKSAPSVEVKKNIPVKWTGYTDKTEVSETAYNITGTLQVQEDLVDFYDITAIASKIVGKVTVIKAKATGITASPVSVDVMQGATDPVAEAKEELKKVTVAVNAANNVSDSVNGSALEWTVPSFSASDVKDGVATATATISSTAHVDVTDLSNKQVSVSINVVTPFEEDDATEVYKALKALPAIADVTFETVEETIAAQSAAQKLYKNASSKAKEELEKNTNSAALLPLVTGKDYANNLATIQAVRATYDVSKALTGITQETAWANAFTIMGAYGVEKVVEASKEYTTFKDASFPATKAKDDYTTAQTAINTAYGWLGLKDIATAAKETVKDVVTKLDAIKANVAAQVTTNVNFSDSYMDALRAVSGDIEKVEEAAKKITWEAADGDVVGTLADVKTAVDNERIEYTYTVSNFRVGKSYSLKISRKADGDGIVMPAIQKIEVTVDKKSTAAATAEDTATHFETFEGKLDENGTSVTFNSTKGFFQSGDEGSTYIFTIKFDGANAPNTPFEKVVGAKSNPSPGGGNNTPNETPKKEYTIKVEESENGKVTADEKAYNGDTVTLTVTPDEGYSLDTITVTDSKGNEVEVSNNKFTMPTSNVTVKATFKEGVDEPDTKDVFSDVPSSHWAYQFIMDLYNAGVVNGNDDGTFGTENNITRAEFTKMAVGVLGLKTSTAASTFVDATASDWYTPYVVAAVEAGIVQGQSDEWFGANENITREDICTILGRALNLEAPATELTFSDKDQISEYAVDYVKVLVDLKIVGGYEDGTFGPKKNATRAESAKMIDGVMKYLAEKDNAGDKVEGENGDGENADNGDKTPADDQNKDQNTDDTKDDANKDDANKDDANKAE